MYKPKTLSNGLQYLVIPTDSQTVAVSILIKTGSVYESKKQNGIAHFLEHMMFKATKKRTSAKELAIDFEKIGAINNAFTSQTTTGYWAKASKEHASHILEILSDIYNNSQFPETEIEKEKGVVIQEMAMYEDMPQQKVSMMMDNLMYPDQPFGRDILGTKQTVSSFTRKDLVNFYKTHYGPENTLVVIAGGIDTKDIEKQVKQLFGAAVKIEAKKQTIADPKVSAKGKRTDILNKKTDQVHMALAIEAPGYEDADRYNVEILATILGRGMSSRLFIKMREELGICYYAHAGYAKLTNSKGQFHIAAGVDTARTQIALNGIWEECLKLTTTEVDQDELKKVKQMLKSGLAMSMETCDDVANFYASQYIRTGKANTLEQIYKKIEAVKSADVLRMAQKLFVAKNVHLTAIGEGIGKLSL